MNQKRGIFGISDDGGLVINNVSVEHETRYKVVKYTTDTRKEIFEIEVKVLGKQQAYVIVTIKLKHILHLGSSETFYSLT